MMIPAGETDTLLQLLDDPDREIFRCVADRISKIGREVMPDLVSKVLSLPETDNGRRRILLSRLGEINASFRQKDLLRIYENPSDFDLGEAVFLLASYFDVTMPRDRWDTFICTGVSLFEADDSEEKTALERLTLFNYLFFNRLHFTMEDTGGAVPISEVITHRCGCPQTVALLWFVLAAESGLPVLPVVLEGGYAPVWIENGREIFRIDLTDNGMPVAAGTGYQMPGKTERPAELKPLWILPILWLESVRGGIPDGTAPYLTINF